MANSRFPSHMIAMLLAQDREWYYYEFSAHLSPYDALRVARQWRAEGFSRFNGWAATSQVDIIRVRSGPFVRRVVVHRQRRDDLDSRYQAGAPWVE